MVEFSPLAAVVEMVLELASAVELDHKTSFQKNKPPSSSSSLLISSQLEQVAVADIVVGCCELSSRLGCIEDVVDFVHKSPPLDIDFHKWEEDGNHSQGGSTVVVVVVLDASLVVGKKRGMEPDSHEKSCEIYHHLPLKLSILWEKWRFRGLMKFLASCMAVLVLSLEEPEV